MGMFDDLVSNALGGRAASQTQTQNLIQGALNLLNSAGGIQGVAAKFQQSGLGNAVSSWIGTGQNEGISAEQITRVLGQDKVDALARQSGIPVANGASTLAEVFPALLDKLTPDGVLPDKSQLMTMGKVILGGVGVAAAAAAAASAFGKKDDEASVAEGAAEGRPVPVEAPAAMPDAAATDQAYTVVSGDSLSKISQHLYGDPKQWSRIFDANRDQLTDPDRIFPGQVLRIP